MKVLILEDEKLAADKLIGLIGEVDSSIEVIAVLKSIAAALTWFDDSDYPDCIISDIQLLDGLSFEVFEQIDFDGPVIFTTAYDQYAIKAFEVNSVDYLLKPVQKEKLVSSLEKINKQQAIKTNIPIQDILEVLQQGNKTYKSRFMLKIGQRLLAVPADKIAYFLSQDRMTYVVTFDGKRYPHDQSLEEIAEQLNPKEFFKVNRKYIVKYESIEEIHPYFKGRVKLYLNPKEEDGIVVSSEKTPEFKKWLDQ